MVFYGFFFFGPRTTVLVTERTIEYWRLEAEESVIAIYEEVALSGSSTAFMQQVN